MELTSTQQLLTAEQLCITLVYEDTYGAANYNTIGENSIVLPPVHQSQKLPSSKKVVTDRNAAKIAQLKRKQMEELQRALEMEEKKDEERDRKLEQAENEETNDKNKWICDQILMENGVVQNYLDCGLSNFGLHLEEAVHHNSRQ